MANRNSPASIRSVEVAEEPPPLHAFTGNRSEIVAGDEVGARKMQKKLLALQAAETTKSTHPRFDT
jgi:hypothetical protein